MYVCIHMHIVLHLQICADRVLERVSPCGCRKADPARTRARCTWRPKHPLRNACIRQHGVFLCVCICVCVCVCVCVFVCVCMYMYKYMFTFSVLKCIYIYIYIYVYIVAIILRISCRTHYLSTKWTYKFSNITHTKTCCFSLKSSSPTSPISRHIKRPYAQERRKGVLSPANVTQLSSPLKKPALVSSPPRMPIRHRSLGVAPVLGEGYVVKLQLCTNAPSRYRLIVLLHCVNVAWCHTPSAANECALKALNANLPP